MHQQTETVKRFHSKPQWQQILAVCTFLGKSWTKKGEVKIVIYLLKLNFCFNLSGSFNWLEPPQSVKIWFVQFGFKWRIGINI